MIDENKLNEVARSWLGTPFAPNSDVKGQGVSCQKLASAVYKEAGIIDLGEVPEVAMAYARFNGKRSLVDEFMDKQDAFVQISAREEMLPGDLLGFVICRIVHHVGVYIGNDQFVHATRERGVTFGNIKDATWGSRHARIWRLK